MSRSDVKNKHSTKTSPLQKVRNTWRHHFTMVKWAKLYQYGFAKTLQPYGLLSRIIGFHWLNCVNRSHTYRSIEWVMLHMKSLSLLVKDHTSVGSNFRMLLGFVTWFVEVLDILGMTKAQTSIDMHDFVNRAASKQCRAHKNGQM